MCVIADEKGVESLAGIMGGEASGCDENTTDVLIESALWDPLNIAQTGRKLGINSDARYRFERGVDPNFMLPGLELATQMVLEFCGGEPSEIVVAGDPTPKEKIIDFPLSELPRLTGLKLPLADVRRALEKLGFFVAGQGDKVKVAVPSWRPDVEGKADIVEEIVRIVGVDRVPSTPFPRGEHARKPVLTADPEPHPQGQARARRARPDRSGDLVVRLQARGRTVRRRQRRRWRSPIRSRRNCPTCGRASSPAWSWRRRRMPTAALPTWRCSRSGRFSRATGRRISSPPRPACAARSPAQAASAAIGRATKPVDAFDAKADAFAVLAAAGAPMQALAGRARRPGVVSPRPLRHHPDRPAEHPRPFRRTASARARSLEGRRPAGRLRGDPGKNPRAQGQGDARKAMLELVAVPAGRARFRLRGRART